MNSEPHLVMSSTETRMRDFAIQRHASAGCHYGDKPYEVHLAAVRQVLAAFGYGHDLLAAAWAHDLIEDTPTTRDEIAELAGQQVASLAWAVTGVGSNRRERWTSVLPKLRTYRRAAFLKLADRVANVEACVATGSPLLKMYRDEHETFCADLDAIIRGHIDMPYDMLERLDKAIH